MYRSAFFLSFFFLLFLRLPAQARDTTHGCALPEDSISLYGIRYYSAAEDTIPDLCKILNDSIEKILNKVYPQSVLPLAIEAYNECKGGADKRQYVDALSNLGYLYSVTGSYSPAIELLLEVEKIYQTEGWDKDIEEYIKFAGLYGATYFQIGNFQKGLEVLEENHARLLSMNADTSITFANNCNMLGSVYGAVGNFEKAFFLLNKSEAYFLEKDDTLNFYFPTLLANKGISYILYGDVKKAELSLKRSIEIYQQIGIKDHPNCLQAKAYLANVYGKLRMNEKGMDLLKNNIGQILENNSHTIADVIILSAYSTLLAQSYRFEEADTLNMLALSIVEKLAGKDSQLYFATLGNLGNSYLDQNKMERAVEYCTEAVKGLKSKSTKAINFYTTLIIANKKLGKNEESKRILSEVLSSLKPSENLFSPDFQHFLSHSIATLTSPSDTALLRHCAGLFFPSVIDFIYHHFPMLTEKEKLQYLERQQIGIQTGGMGGMFFSPLRNDPQTARYFYDLSLAFKGILLEDMNRLGDAIVEKGSPDLKRLYGEWKGNRQVLTKQYGLDSLQRQLSAEDLYSLQRKTDNLEIHLGVLSASFRKTLADVRWQDIREYLIKTDEETAAIEFIHFRLVKDGLQFSDSIIYCALILRKDSPSPQLVWLFNGLDLRKDLNIKASSDITEFENIYMAGNKMYNRIWKPLAPFLSGVREIYFSPSGLLNQVAFNGILCPDNQLLSDKYILKQVGSTRDILLLKKQEEGRRPFSQPGTALVVGGIPYDTSYNCTEKVLQPEKSIDLDPEMRRLKCNKLPDLEGSLRITLFLDSLFRAKHWNIQTLSGCAASEGNLKLLLAKGLSPRIIHIDTHGIIEVKPSDTTIVQLYPELPDNALNYASLAFAGFNNKCNNPHQRSPAGDGEIFATEFRDLNLSGTELVVLSACKSSIGPTNGEEGMFGLQRAFRLAGARHVLATLYDVGDVATAVFMEYLYQNLLNGKDISSALRLAQNQMRQHKDYYHPYYWVGYVLL